MSVRPKVIEQDPAEKLAYRVRVLGDTIADADWSCIPEGPTISTPVNTSGSSSSTSDVFVSGVQDGVTYELRVDGVTGGGTEFVRTLTIMGVTK